MFTRWSLPALTFATLSFSCGGGMPEGKTASTSSELGEEPPTTDLPEETVEEEVAGPMKIPTECHGTTEPCTPDPKWVKRLCEDVYPAVALHLFQGSSPFTRGYISARKVKAVNASGGATSGDEWLTFDEEVIFLHHQSSDLGGMQVSGAGGGYEAMRLDGSCVTLGSDEVRTAVPPSPKHVKIPWRYIGKDMQNALRSSPAIKDAYIERRNECKGAFSGTVTDRCLKKDNALNLAILSALADGKVDLPQPENRP